MLPLRIGSIAFFLCLFTGPLCAQYDSIRFVTGARQAALILEITDKTVRYKNPHDTAGPVYTVPIKKVEQFILKDGCIDLKSKGYANCKKDPTFGVIKNEDFTRTIIGLDLLQAANLHFEPSIDHVFADRNVGIHAYFNYGFINDLDSSNYRRIECRMNGGDYYKKTFAGLDLKFFPGLHKKHTFWLALGMERGMATHKVDDYRVKMTKYQNGVPYYVNISGPYSWYTEKFYQEYHVKFGYVNRFGKHLVCQESLTLGVSQFGTDIDPTTGQRTKGYAYAPSVWLSFSVGYGF